MQVRSMVGLNRELEAGRLPSSFMAAWLGDAGTRQRVLKMTAAFTRGGPAPAAGAAAGAGADAAVARARDALRADLVPYLCLDADAAWEVAEAAPAVHTYLARVRSAAAPAVRVRPRALCVFAFVRECV
jgi:hypothetical protein